MKIEMGGKVREFVFFVRDFRQNLATLQGISMDGEWNGSPA